MDTNTVNPIPTTTTTTTSTRPGPGRRAALAVTGFLACALPVVFAVNLTRMLLVGEEPTHRFHQATGQGLVLCALWLVPLLALLRAGWAGRRPSPAAGWQHVAFTTTGVVAAAIATGGGAPYLVGVIAVTGALLWAALPQRPRLLGPVRVDPVLAPLALLTTAWLMPYAVDQLRAQNAVTGGHHAHNPHLFDMAWMSLTVMALAVLAALLPQLRRLVGWVAGACLVTGAAGLAFGEPTTWSVLTLALGAAAAGAAALGARRHHS